MNHDEQFTWHLDKVARFKKSSIFRNIPLALFLCLSSFLYDCSNKLEQILIVGYINDKKISLQKATSDHHNV